MTHKELEDIRCPKCGEELDKGFIAGYLMRLRWTIKANTYTVFAGKALKQKRNYLSAPIVSAMRCEKCKLGVFSYDN